MIVSRWQAPMVPDVEQIKLMFEAEGLVPFEELIEPKQDIKDHRHPFDEVRMVAQGELHLNVAGNMLLLRPGDKIVIPSNTKHSKKVLSESSCLCICAHRSF